MADLKLSQLPDRTPIKLSISVLPDLHQALADYAALYAQTYGRDEAMFDERRRAVLALLGFTSEEPTVTGGNGDDYGVAGVFLRLVELPDSAVIEVIAVVIGETLAAGSAAVAAVGTEIGIDMADWWQADEALFGLIRDREVLGSMVAEVAGQSRWPN